MTKYQNGRTFEAYPSHSEGTEAQVACRFKAFGLLHMADIFRANPDRIDEIIRDWFKDDRTVTGEADLYSNLLKNQVKKIQVRWALDVLILEKERERLGLPWANPVDFNLPIWVIDPRTEDYIIGKFHPRNLRERL